MQEKCVYYRHQAAVGMASFYSLTKCSRDTICELGFNFCSQPGAEAVGGGWCWFNYAILLCSAPVAASSEQIWGVGLEYGRLQWMCSAPQLNAPVDTLFCFPPAASCRSLDLLECRQLVVSNCRVALAVRHSSIRKWVPRAIPKKIIFENNVVFSI